jgi:hypothetical protein
MDQVNLYQNNYLENQLYYNNNGNNSFMSKFDGMNEVYLNEEEIDKFMENYLRENPDVEIETRYLRRTPVEFVQEYQVRWLQPETPDIPPIIIQAEQNEIQDEQPPIRIIEKRRDTNDNVGYKSTEPVVYREQPPHMRIVEPKVIIINNTPKPDKRKLKRSNSI